MHEDMAFKFLLGAKRTGEKKKENKNKNPEKGRGNKFRGFYQINKKSEFNFPSFSSVEPNTLKTLT